MTFDEFQEKSKRTMSDALSFDMALCNYAMGLAGEAAGEVNDYIKKVVFHGHELDKGKLAEEMGDCLFYLAALATTVGLSLTDVAKMNVTKLLARYPNGFDPERSINRG